MIFTGSFNGLDIGIMLRQNNLWCRAIINTCTFCHYRNY